MSQSVPDTPMLRQYKSIKSDYDDCILFFRLGDFYELFLDDAIIASKLLGLTLTGRGKDQNRIPMCGVPHHSANNYINKLVKFGHKIAICDQVEDASASVGLTKRDVVKVITPGCLIDSDQLDDLSNNYICSISYIQNTYNVCFTDISTGDCQIINEIEYENMLSFIKSINASELLIEESILDKFNTELKIPVTSFNPLSINSAYQSLLTHFNLTSFKSFGLSETANAYPAAFALFDYIKFTQKNSLQQINKITNFNLNDYLKMDYTTQKNLELIESFNNDINQSTLFSTVNQTKTAMGARFLKRRITHPFSTEKQISTAQKVTESFYIDTDFLETIRSALNEIYDFERIMARLQSNQVSPKDLVSLKDSLVKANLVKDTVLNYSHTGLVDIKNYFIGLDHTNNFIEKLITLIENAIIENPPNLSSAGGFIKEGYSSELDMLNSEFQEIRNWINSLEESERERTGIKQLKVGYNKVFGYYFEITNSNKHLVPENYIRKQTLTNAERFITPELKDKEVILLNGEEKQKKLESKIFKEVITLIIAEIHKIQELALIISEIDCHQSFAFQAHKNGYSMPTLSTDKNHILHMVNGTHPVVANQHDSQFVKNTVCLDQNNHNFALITGPNMAGKSTVMRQIALLVILAQSGSFVPCEQFTLSPVDNIFTRIGSLDNLYSGHSTFMVEMLETAAILNLATPNSLVILDEVGRGTATFDGMSIAYSLCKYLLENINCRTLFSTHYHELTILDTYFKTLKNFTMAVDDNDNEVRFLYKLVTGSINKSYGIHVAKMAGMPDSVISDASYILNGLEKDGSKFLESLNNTDTPATQTTSTSERPTFIEDKPVEMPSDEPINLTETDSVYQFSDNQLSLF